MREPKFWTSIFAEKVLNAYDNGDLTENNIEAWDTAYNGGRKPIPPFNTGEIIKYYKTTGHDPRSYQYDCNTSISIGISVPADIKISDIMIPFIQELFNNCMDNDTNSADLVMLEDSYVSIYNYKVHYKLESTEYTIAGDIEELHREVKNSFYKYVIKPLTDKLNVNELDYNIDQIHAQYFSINDSSTVYYI